MIPLEQFGLAINSSLITPTSRNYRPPSWPPPRDWVVVEDAQGNPISCWGDSIWRFDPWAGKSVSINFGDGPVTHTTQIDRANADLLRLLVTWRLWGPRGARTVNTLVTVFSVFRNIVALCSRNGILASDLMRFPAVMDQVPQALAPSTFSTTVTELHRFLDAQQALGFVLLDQHGLKRLVAAQPQHEKEQTPYIPPRIWSYQINRLRECLEDYLAHRQQVEDCFQFCLDAYARNYGSLTAAMTTRIDSRLPFQESPCSGSGAHTGCIFYGHFVHTVVRFAPSEEDKANPYLLDRAYEPWSTGDSNIYSIRKRARDYKEFLSKYPELFSEEVLRITEDDIKVARSISPTINSEEFQVGKPWPFAWHQLRRTGAVNMFASGLISDSSMQYLMKHASRMMPLYYGQGHSRLCLNEDARVLVVNAMYEAMGKEILNLISERFVSPYGDERKAMIVVNLVSEPDAKRFADSARKGEMFFRSMRLGSCVKREACTYGGVESISHCAGTDGNQPCVDILYDKEKSMSNRMYLESVERRLVDAPAGSPLHLSLEAEKRGLESYFDVINRN